MCPIPAHESSHVRREWRARSSEGSGRVANPTAAWRNWPLVEHGLLDNLIRPSEHWRRDLQTELLRRLEVDHQFELAWLLDGKVRGLGAFEDLVHIGGGTPIQIGKARSIRHDPPTSTNSRHPYIDG